MGYVNEDQMKNQILENNITERKISDDRYAPMLVKTIVYTFVGLILLTFVGILTGIVKTRSENIVQIQ